MALTYAHHRISFDWSRAGDVSDLQITLTLAESLVDVPSTDNLINPATDSLINPATYSLINHG